MPYLASLERTPPGSAKRCGKLDAIEVSGIPGKGPPSSSSSAIAGALQAGVKIRAAVATRAAANCLELIGAMMGMDGIRTPVEQSRTGFGQTTQKGSKLGHNYVPARFESPEVPA
jgi:hypothetical protein